MICLLPLEGPPEKLSSVIAAGSGLWASQEKPEKKLTQQIWLRYKNC